MINALIAPNINSDAWELIERAWREWGSVHGRRCPYSRLKALDGGKSNSGWRLERRSRVQHKRPAGLAQFAERQSAA